MAAPVLLTGGTGTLGRLVTPLLRERGYAVRILSRSTHERSEGVEYVVGDLSRGTGLAAAVKEVETIIHCGGSSKGDDVKTRHLVEAAVSAGRPHLVYISVVGADRVPMASTVDRLAFGYYGAKAAAERVVVESGLPWTTLRATQFHDLVLATVAGLTRLPVAPVLSGIRFQPVDAGEVASRLVELALGRPAGLVPDLGGPATYSMAELVHGYLARVGKRRSLLPIRLPGKAARAMRAGANLAPDHALGRRTWEEFLAERLAD